MKQKQKQRKGFYVSFNSEELDRLALASHTELALYFILKRLASFEDGWVGMFHRQALTYEELAKRISRVSSQGKPADVYDRSEAFRLVERLKNRGLISQIQQLGGRLVMLLPLSPLVEEPQNQGKKVATPEPAPGQVPAEKLQQAESVTLKPENAEAFWDVDFDEVPVFKKPSVSVMTVLEDSSLSIPPISNDRCPEGDTVDDRDAKRPVTSSRLVEKHGFDEDQGEDGSADEAEGKKDDALTVGIIIKCLRAAKVFSWVETDRSKALYERWVKFGVSKEEFADALQAVMEDPKAEGKPDEINAIIQKHRNGGGGAGRKRSGLVL